MSERTPGSLFPVVIAAPSGTGKTTVCRDLLERDARLRLSVSHTTRVPRNGEHDGRDYYFVSVPDFEALVEADGFVEWAKYSGRYYGTGREMLQEILEGGADALLEIEVQGARQVHEGRSDALLIFLLPPSMEVLEQRLRDRGTDASEQIERRLAEAPGEIAAAELFDYVVVNEALDATVEHVFEILCAERSGDTSSVRGRFGVPEALQRWKQSQGL
jgi:guanylate kinase